MRQDAHLYSWTLAVGISTVLLLWWTCRSRLRVSAWSRAWLCLVTALVVTPTALLPFQKWLIYPAWFPCVACIVGFLNPLGALLFGLLPLILVAGILYVLLHFFCSRAA